MHIEDLPKSLCESRGKLRAGLKLPYPSGPHWQNLISNHAYQKKHSDKLNIDDSMEEQTYIAMRLYRQMLDRDVPALALLCRALIAEQATQAEVTDLLESVVSTDTEELGLAAAFKARRLKGQGSRQKISVTSDPEPKTMIEALMGDRAVEWVESIYKEFNGLIDQGVFSHGPPGNTIGGWTKDDLDKAGITGKPVPCSIALTHKYKDGILEKLKTRICIAGHKGNVTN